MYKMDAEMDFTEIGTEYKNFVVIGTEELKDYKSKAVHLRHKTTGLEVYHIINDDEENLFSFCFRTLAKNSKGAAHIIEHSVLCGSEKFPLKEPFTTLDNQSLHTFLNAMTYPEKTLYPASSVVESDYFNLFDVYADAVFFPKLSEQTFMQEGWRLEYDKDGKPSIQGVVYNEMKSSYSSFSQVAVDEFLSKMYPDSIFCYESGGDPLEIPSLTYNDFLDFHKRFYKPSNCLLFLYGNISTQKQLDFFDEKYIKRLENKFGAAAFDCSVQFLPLSKEISDLQKTTRITESAEVSINAPVTGATGNMVGIGWYTGEYSMEQYFVSEVLGGNDSSPMSRKLKESGLGDDEAPISGSYGYVYDNTLFSYGLSGVKAGNENKVYKLIMDSLEEICKEGIASEDIESAIMGIDFHLREQNRYFGPRSINFASKAAACWCAGKNPGTQLSPITEFEKLKERIRNNPDYVLELVKKYFIDNKTILKYTAVPSKKYIENRNKKEEEIVRNVESRTKKEAVLEQLKLLHEYQEKVETDEELKCIPHLSVADLKADVDTIKAEYIEIKNDKGIEIPVVLSKENTNGIVYAEVCFPIDNLQPEYAVDFPLFLGSLTNLGWNKKGWSKCTSDMACIMGDINVKALLSSIPQIDEVKENISHYSNKNIFNRYWLNFSSKFLTEKTDECLDLLAEIVTKLDFDDVEHMQTLMMEYKTDRKEAVANYGNQFVMYRGRAFNSKSNAIQEIFYGITQNIYVNKLKKKHTAELLAKYKKMYEFIFNQGAVLHITADDDSIKKVTAKLSEFVNKAELKELKPRGNYEKEDYFPYIYMPKKYNKNNSLEVLKLNTQSGYSGLFFECAPYLSKEAAAEEVLCNYLNAHQLWVKIRMQGGAYGGSCNNDCFEQLFVMASWRDPTPFKSLESFEESLKEVSQMDFSKEDVERCILSSYSPYIMPDSPVGRGNRGFTRILCGNSNALINKMIENVLAVTPEDLHTAAVKLYNSVKSYSKSVVLCDNSVKTCGNIIKIPL